MRMDAPPDSTQADQRMTSTTEMSTLMARFGFRRIALLIIGKIPEF